MGTVSKPKHSERQVARSTSSGPGGRQPGSGGRPATPPRARSTSTWAFGAVGLVVVVVVVVVVVAALGGGKKGPTGSSANALRSPMPQSVTDTVQSGWAAVASSVGLPSTSVVAPPHAAPSGAPLLTAPGSSLPAVAFVGAEFCPYCAAERWAIVMALGQFGRFGALQQTTSSSYDVYPGTATFSFYPTAPYTSQYVTLSATEEADNRPIGGQYSTLAQPPAWVASIYQKYDNSAGYPFLDIGNRVLVESPTYLPDRLTGLNASQIAQRLSNPSDPVTQDIVGAATYLVAGICSVTGNQPAAVCSVPVVARAKIAIGLH